MEVARASALLEALRARGLNSCSLAQCQEFLSRVVLDQLPMAEGVYEVGSYVLKAFGGKLGDGIWDMYERVVQAALQLGKQGQPEVVAMLVALRKQFPISHRVTLLLGMVQEAKGDFRNADELYNEVLVAMPTNAVAMKRKICIATAQGATNRAVKMLTQYVKLFSADINAWKQLVDLYVSMGKLDCAQFACEELLLIAPENYLFHLLCGDILYAQARDKDDFRSARHYYAQALELKPEGNARALYGLLMCVKQAGTVDKDAVLFQGARKELLALYATHSTPALTEIVTQVFHTSSANAEERKR